MFEGENQIVFSEETANRLFSDFMTNLFSSPIKVTSIEKDYKGVTIDFTEAEVFEGKDEEKGKDANTPSKSCD